MRVPESWLREFVDLDWDIYTIAERLTFSGTSVEDVLVPFNVSGKILTGKIIDRRPHPSLEKLLVCSVDVGERLYTVVTADKSVRVGDFVLVALPGTTLHNGARVEPRTFGDIVSEAMLCSLEELGLEEKSEVVYRFPGEVQVGLDVVKTFGLDERVLELEITPNRPDCLSVYGVARELSALSGRPLKKPAPQVIFTGEEEDFEVLVEDDRGCPRYTARIVKGVKVGDSPLWMKARLVAAGMRSINNVVDCTNYVMLETGHPVHAFDMRKLKHRRIVVRAAKGGERVLLLDEKEYELRGGEVIITDGENVLALGGVMGGLESGVSEDTEDLVLEVAYFDPVRIRKTSKSLGLITESSYRFERGVDPNDAEYVSLRLSELIQKVAGGKVLERFWDVYPRKIEPRKILLRKERVRKILGTEVDGVKELLEGLELRVEEVGSSYYVTVPTFRPDLEREIDLIEEIGRISGYEKIEPKVISVPAVNIGWTKRQIFRRELAQYMRGMGFDEVITFSFVDGEFVRKYPVTDKELVFLVNPIASDMNVMRPSQFYSLISVFAENFKRQNRDLKLFEIGKVYYKSGGAYVEEETLAAICGGLENPRDYTDKRETSFYTVKGVLDELFERLGVEVSYERTVKPGFFPTRTARILASGEEIGLLGMVDPELLKELDVKGREVYFFELKLQRLFESMQETPSYRPTPKFPSIRRDVSILVPKDFESLKIVRLFEKIGGNVVEEVGVSDVYEGKGVPDGYTSVTFYVVFRSPDRTLTDEEVNDLFERMVSEAEKMFGVRRRF